jgi:hypothetical protein
MPSKTPWMRPPAWAAQSTKLTSVNIICDREEGHVRERGEGEAGTVTVIVTRTEKS